MKRVKPNRWLPLLVATWGVVTTLSGIVHNFSGLLAIRFFLGLCEGGILPGMVSIVASFPYGLCTKLSQVLYLSTLYKPHELQLRFDPTT